MNLAASPLAEAAPAKINLALHVTGRRGDGYHLIESLAVFTRFGDRLQVSAAEEDGLAVSGRYAAGVPVDGRNLIAMARDALRKAAGSRNAFPVAIALEKNLPVASGIGGGSSDAAAALRLLARIWGLDIDAAELAGIALSLGADVPMCLAAQPLMARGIGENVEPLPAVPSLGLVLVNPGAAVSTPDVFARLTRRDSESPPPLPRAIDFHSLRGWLETTRNDLEAAAREIQPAIGRALAALDGAGSGFSRMSGSGATCFGLFDDRHAAETAGARLAADHPGWWVAPAEARF